jgi:hypothetical protein
MIETNRRESKLVFVARNKHDGMYVRLGQETGIGQTIQQTRNLDEAQVFGSPTAIMRCLGGHYSFYDAISVSIVYQEIGFEQFPPEERVWG